MLNEVFTIDEVFFFLHLRNLFFEGPQLAYPSSTFEVISLVKFDVVKHIIIVQFKQDDHPSKELESFIEDIKSRTVQKGKNLYVDAYFALRMCLQYYMQEKKLFLARLRESFARFSLTGGSDMNSMLGFFEFRDFCRSNLKHTS